ncbi:MAG: DNA polymerase III subunit beta [Actinomycetota bacterium]
MELEIEREVLADAVAWAARSLPQRPALPVLGGILLEAFSDSSMQFSSHDFEMSSKVSVSIDLKSAGKAVVSGRLLSEISKTLPAHPVRIKVSEKKFQINCGPSKFNLPLMPTEDYPELPKISESIGRVQGRILSTAIQQVCIAAGRDDTLPVLTGVKFEFHGEEITLFSTDRYRLAKKIIQWSPQKSDLNLSVLVSARTINEISRALTSEEEVEISLSNFKSSNNSVSEGSVGISTKDRCLTSRILDGDYPKVSSLFPSSSEHNAIVNTAELYESVKRISLVAERNFPVRLSWREEGVVVEAGQGDEAFATEEVKGKINGEDFDVAFNPQYLLDSLNSLRLPYAVFSFTSPTKPVLITGRKDNVGDDIPDYQHVLMPIRVSN